MKDLPYFVMLWGHNGRCVTPMITEDDEVAMFNTEDEAMSAALNNDRASALGFDVFQMGGGVNGCDAL